MLNDQPTRSTTRYTCYPKLDADGSYMITQETEYHLPDDAPDDAIAQRVRFVATVHGLSGDNDWAWTHAEKIVRLLNGGE